MPARSDSAGDEAFLFSLWCGRERTSLGTGGTILGAGGGGLGAGFIRGSRRLRLMLFKLKFGRCFVQQQVVCCRQVPDIFLFVYARVRARTRARACVCVCVCVTLPTVCGHGLIKFVSVTSAVPLLLVFVFADVVRLAFDLPGFSQEVCVCVCARACVCVSWVTRL